MFKGKNIVLVSLLVLMFLLPMENLPVSMANNTSTITQYVYLAINIYGNGNLTVYVPGTSIYQTINKTTTFKVPADLEVELWSNQPFWLGNGTLITTAFWGPITKNTTLNVYFNISGITYPPSEYTKITVVDEGKLNLTVVVGGFIFNDPYLYYLTQFYIDNSSATFYVPIKSIIFIHYGSNFYVNGSSATKLSNFHYLYQYIVKSSAPAILVVTSTENTTTTTTNTTTSTTTSTLPRTTVITLPTPNTTVTITPHSGTVIPTSTSSNSLTVYAIIAVVVIVLVAFFVLRRVRK